MKNNIVIMNFSGVYEVQGLKAVLEAGKTNNHIISQLDCQDIPGTNCCLLYTSPSPRDTR